jgi:hypothetical protein
VPSDGRRFTGACTLACMAATQAWLTDVKPTSTEARQGKERGGFAGYRQTRCSRNGGGEGGGCVAGHAGRGGAPNREEEGGACRVDRPAYLGDSHGKGHDEVEQRLEDVKPSGNGRRWLAGGGMQWRRWRCALEMARGREIAGPGVALR